MEAPPYFKRGAISSVSFVNRGKNSKQNHVDNCQLIVLFCLFVSDAAGPLTETTVPAIVGLFIALTILSFLLCFMFKLFTQSRWARTRSYADAGQPPPTITLEGKRALIVALLLLSLS